MKIPLRQTEWLGFNLVEIGKSLNHDVSKIAGTKFYNKIYENVFNDENFVLNQSWLEKKNNLSNWLISFLKNNRSQQSSILSVGCGFGVVEVPLIKQGIHVDLQECQPYSVQYMQKNHPHVFEKTKFILSQDLSNIPTNSYDVIISLTSTYCLDNDTLMSFLKAIKRILKKDGIFVWYETVLSLSDIINFMKTIILNRPINDSVLWGWKRSLNHQNSLARKNGLKSLNNIYFNADNLEINPPKIMGFPQGASIAWQAGIYVND